MLMQNYCIESNSTLYQTMLYLYGHEEICPSRFLSCCVHFSVTPSLLSLALRTLQTYKAETNLVNNVFLQYYHSVILRGCKRPSVLRR